MPYYLKLFFSYGRKKNKKIVENVCRMTYNGIGNDTDTLRYMGESIKYIKTSSYIFKNFGIINYAKVRKRFQKYKIGYLLNSLFGII